MFSLFLLWGMKLQPTYKIFSIQPHSKTHFMSLSRLILVVYHCHFFFFFNAFKQHQLFPMCCCHGRITFLEVKQRGARGKKETFKQKVWKFLSCLWTIEYGHWDLTVCARSTKIMLHKNQLMPSQSPGSCPWTTFPWVLLLSMMPHGLEHPLDQLGPAVPAASPPNSLCTPSPIPGGVGERHKRLCPSSAEPPQNHPRIIHTISSTNPKQTPYEGNTQCSHIFPGCRHWCAFSRGDIARGMCMILGRKSGHLLHLKCHWGASHKENMVGFHSALYPTCHWLCLPDWQ